MTKLKTVGRIAIPVAMALLPVLALAQVYSPDPGIAGGNPITLQEIENTIKLIAQFLVVVGVIIAVIFIIWGGITYMAAGGNEDKAKAAKTRIFNGIIGAAVVIGVGVILQTVARLVTRSFFN